MAEVVEVLRAARAKIERPECWTKRALARDALGHPIRPEQDEAFCYCTLGAICSVNGYQADAIDFLRDFVPGKKRSLGDFNDDPRTTHADILALFDRAIAKAAQP